MDDAREPGHLNPSQRLHLLTSCQYADKLLSEIEATLAASQSKSPFPKFKPDISPAQAKVVKDYIARMRAQLVRILDSQGVPIPAPRIGSGHSVRVTLGFVDIAFDECRPKRMAGYGELADTSAVEIAGLVDEMQGIVSRLSSYLAQDQSAGLENRLRRLEQAGGDIALVKSLERAINQNGLVEFRPALGTIIDRLETETFEIAVFGRVSSGKSSLLNHIAGQDLLPVGVNPITAVPTRLAYGPKPRATAWFADRPQEQFGIERLAEFVTEQRNPSNVQHVTRIVVELPAPRLSEGVVYVDTPGLGSLATSGAAETKAYLPKCDLGVVLIDAGSTLTQDDLSTIETLYDAGIPASVLLSKADLLAPADRERAIQYVAGHIRSDLGLELPVHAISIKAEHSGLLEKWLDTEILPLYDRHAELARQSLNRKIGALRLGVEAALKARLRRSGPAGHDGARVDIGKVRELETELRTASGNISQARTACIDTTDALRECEDGVIRAAANGLMEAWASGAGATGESLVKKKLEQAAAEPASQIASAIQQVARDAGRALAKAALALDLANQPERDELLDVLKNMPRFDLGNLEIEVRPSAVASLLGRRWAAARVERRIRSQAGSQIAEAVGIYARVLQAWVRKTFAELQEQFDSYADGYRAHLDRLTADRPEAEDEQALRDDLASLAAAENAAHRSTPGTAA
ncbi:MAG: dynamin family protein [Bryobacteraceae bacterium]|jgi:GTP-binding protein EngB required for normal cell division